MDRKILSLPFAPRLFLAFLISSLRAPFVAKKYRKLGGRSPQFEATERQAKALKERSPAGTEIFIAYRHAQPTIEEAIRAIQEQAPTSLTVLPLFPHYSEATTGSALEVFERAWNKARLPSISVQIVRSFPEEEGFIKALAEEIESRLPPLRSYGVPRILFSAHGLPEEAIEKGDPYVEEIKKTCKALEKETGEKGILCFQSRFGFKKWTGPSLREELEKAGSRKEPVLVVPLSFVSDHIETIIELGEEERTRAQKAGIPAYEVCQPPMDRKVFIEGLRNLIKYKP